MLLKVASLIQFSAGIFNSCQLQDYEPVSTCAISLMSTDGTPDISSTCRYFHSTHRQQFHQNLALMPFSPTRYAAAVHRLPAVKVWTSRLHLPSVFHTCSMDTFIKMCLFWQHCMTLCRYLTHFSSLFRFIILLCKPTGPDSWLTQFKTIIIQFALQPRWAWCGVVVTALCY